MDARQASRTEPLAQTELAEYECRACAGGPSTKRGPRSERGTRSVGKRWQRLRLTQTVTHHLARITAEARHPPRDWRPDGRGQCPEQPRQLLRLARSGSLPRPRTSTRRSSSPARSATRRGEGETLAHPRRHPPRTLAARRGRRTRASPSGRATTQSDTTSGASTLNRDTNTISPRVTSRAALKVTKGAKARSLAVFWAQQRAASLCAPPAVGDHGGDDGGDAAAQLRPPAPHSLITLACSLVR